MRVAAVSVGLPRAVQDEQRGSVRTGIWKQPVDGPVRVGRLNLAGDGQADLDNHGGEHMAVYAYPAEHYALWRQELGRMELGGMELGPGAFGENLTVEGLLETEVRIGDRLRIGTAEFEVSQPRTPCFKLALRLGVPTVVKRMVQTGRCGFYLRVRTEGELAAGMPVAWAARAADSLTVAEVFRLMRHAREDRAGVARAAALPALSPSWRAEFAQLAEAARGTQGLR